MIKILIHTQRKIFLVSAAAQVVQLAVVVEQIGFLFKAAQRQEQLNPLIPRHRIIGIVGQNQQRGLYFRDMEYRRISEVHIRCLIQGLADAALLLLVLELSRQTGAPANAGISAGHITDRRTRLGSAKTVGLRDHPRNLISTPRMALNANRVLIDPTLLNQDINSR